MNTTKFFNGTVYNLTLAEGHYKIRVREMLSKQHLNVTIDLYAIPAVPSIDLEAVSDRNNIHEIADFILNVLVSNHRSNSHALFP